LAGPESDLQIDKVYPDRALRALRRRRRRSGLVAVTLSLLVHAALVSLVFLSSLWARARGGPELVLLDTRAPGGPELSIVLVERGADSTVKAATVKPPMARAQPVVAPRQAPAPSALVAAHERAAGPSSSRGLTEEQEPPFGSGANRFPGKLSSGFPGRSGKPAFFQIETDAHSVVYVIDRSASMGPNGGLRRAKLELLASLEQLPPATRFQIIPYNRRAETLCINGTGELVPASQENRQAARLLVEKIQPEGGTEHAPALRRALALRPEVIFFLTDADDLQASDIADLTRFNQGRTQVHAIGLRSDAGRNPLQVLAQQNGGTFRLIDPAQ
jgi:hypothetical protein